MSNKKEYVKLWLSYDAYFEAYSAAEVGRLVLAMINYKSSGVEPEFSGNERFIWPAIRRDIDESNIAQESLSDQKRFNIQKRWSKKTHASIQNDTNDTDVYGVIQNDTNDTDVYGVIQNDTNDTKDKGQRIKDNNNPPIIPPCKNSLLDFGGELRLKLENWLRYKAERQEDYKPTGFQSFISEVKKQQKQYTDSEICDLIDLSMSNNWKGIAWSKLSTEKNKSAKGKVADTAGSSIDKNKLDKFIDSQFDSE